MELTTLFFLNAVRALHGLGSDYQLAKFLGLPQTTISNYRTGRSLMTEGICLKIARALDLNPAIVLLSVAHEREKNPEVKQAYLDTLDKVRPGIESGKTKITWGELTERVQAAMAAAKVGVKILVYSTAVGWLMSPPSPAEARISHNQNSAPTGPIYTYATKWLARLTRWAYAALLGRRRSLATV